MKKIILYMLIGFLFTQNFNKNQNKNKKKYKLNKKKLNKNSKKRVFTFSKPITQEEFSSIEINESNDIIKLEAYKKVLNIKKIEYEKNLDDINKKISEIEKKIIDIENIKNNEDSESDSDDLSDSTIE